MAENSQEGHFFDAESPLGEDVLLLESFSGHEGVSQLFRFTLQLSSSDDSIDPGALLRENVSVSVLLPDGSKRFIHGKVNRFSQKGTTLRYTDYEAEIVPWLWFLSLSSDCRVFQNKTVLEIIEEIFKDHSMADYEIKCLESYAPREYCVQYRETDLNFVSRLMEEEGIFYFFEHSAGSHKLVLADSPDTIPKSLHPEATVEMESSGYGGEDVIREFQREHSVHTTAITLTDYDYLQPSLNLQSSASTDGMEEIYDFPGGYTKVPDGDRYADLILKERSAQQEVVKGSGTCRGFQSGHQFELKDYYRRDANQAYLLVSISHQAWGGGHSSVETPGTYTNQFECIPVRVPFRPPRKSQKPSVKGSQTALVVGPSGEEIYTDEHGRVKVQFPWDREGKKDENSSCWVRVSHPWAGKGWGAIAVPRIGQEVIVDFLEGDPDRPIITGRVYNAEQIPPYSLPAKKTQTGIKSRSSKSGDTSTFNEIRMEDKKGSELLYVHAEKDKQVTVENNRFEDVGNDESIKIGNNRTESVGNNEGINIGANQTLAVTKTRNVSIGADDTLTVGKNLSEDVGKNRSESIGENHKAAVGKNANLSVGATYSVSVGKNHTESVEKAFALKAKDGILIDSKKEIILKSGSASITLKKSGDIEIKGKKINIKASGDVTVKGSKIKLN